MTNKEVIDILEDMKVKIAIPKSAKTQLNRNEALEIAIAKLKANDKDEMVVEDIKNIIKRYDDMNLTASFEERKENHIKAYMEIKDYFNDYTMKYVIKGKDKNTGEVIECAEFRNKEPAQFLSKKLNKSFGKVYEFWVETQSGITKNN